MCLFTSYLDTEYGPHKIVERLIISPYLACSISIMVTSSYNDRTVFIYLTSYQWNDIRRWEMNVISITELIIFYEVNFFETSGIEDAKEDRT